MTLKEAQRWPDLLDIVRREVKPERDRLRDNADGRRRRQYWWQFGRWTPALYAAIAPLQRCLVTAQVTKHLCFSFQPTDRVFSQKLCVFPFDANTQFAILQSRIHEPWVWLLSSTMKTDLNYSASDCFQTFPFPHPNPRTVIPALERIGKELYEARAKYMVDTDQGLTKTYNKLKDPRCEEPPIIELRRLHEELDRTVLEAYGCDLPVPPYCPKSDEDEAALEVFKRAVVEHLYTLNAERSVAEAAEAASAPRHARTRRTLQGAARSAPQSAAPSSRPPRDVRRQTAANDSEPPRTPSSTPPPRPSRPPPPPPAPSRQRRAA